jgi:hypothetical protein
MLEMANSSLSVSKFLNQLFLRTLTFKYFGKKIFIVPKDVKGRCNIMHNQRISIYLLIVYLLLNKSSLGLTNTAQINQLL